MLVPTLFRRNAFCRFCVGGVATVMAVLTGASSHAGPEIYWVQPNTEAETGQVVLTLKANVGAANPYDVTVNWAYGTPYGPATLETARFKPTESCELVHVYDALSIKKYGLKKVEVWLHVSNPKGKDNWRRKITLPDPKPSRH
jgi:hypothetical protein